MVQVMRVQRRVGEELGQGGFGIVYKGSLPNGHQVAVKVLTKSKENGEEFINEVASISRTSHVNIVRLLGFCLDGSKRALIYDFMPNGSLERFIFNNSYGMMVLEMVGGRKNLDVTTTSSSATYFPHYLYKNINQYCVEACGDNGEATEIVRKMILVALWCIQTMPDDRPSMSRVVNMLEGDISDLQLPPKP
ncbi:LEAF RUST 10 DISEASE-RESISTANCE LOCUS RECEPTOR-LIKE PROTEIN KINASE-like 2.4 [Ananas comosus]|uniref:LEAF RUST 10 DISEASE-RESISTANCE LOCUS RECEPTOR-LIKE PROTEIN KINASE-like 2.4 n=1 Tax=Ananas comosus TaxID=4615 RepID=A0A6P5EMS0_ANACO|nr:LEAF RUST 10 DISEASE-RESISTANCE LOCUS RECEPTOR-LIKE PROTEIN KINASE-like 2.4 [Ananas comosus]